MKNLYLNTAHDLETTASGQLRITGVFSEEVAQKLKSRLLMFQGEWWLDPSKGVPFYQDVLRKRPDSAGVSALIKKAILDTEGVTEITKFSLTLDNAARKVSISFSALLTDGSTISEEVSA